jgi:adenylate cyclase
MPEDRVQRRLAAILAADVVGYSRLMELDEVGTLAALKSRRKDILAPLVAKHQGRVFKVTGDGVMVEFASAVNAVQCAIDLQQAMTEAANQQPEDRRIVLRIGINLGDVVVERGDLYGDGVNIAARLETAADPGGIFISGTAYDQVRNKFETAFEELGEQSLKNIGAPVRVYRVAGLARLPIAAAVAANKPSIAVLPFVSMSGDVEQQYFGDGITEDIITELARFRSLHVLARNTSFRYRGQDVDVQRVGRELGVQYIVEGSVRRIGDRIRITAQLIDTATGHHVWAERFDRNQEELFAVQDQVVKTIAATLVGRMQAAATERAQRKPPASLAAYELVLKGDALPLYRPGSAEEARKLFEQAIALDPGYAKAYALLANLEMTDWYRDFNAPPEILDRAFALAQKAVAIDPNDPHSQVAVARLHQTRGAYARAEYHYGKARELNPNSALLMAGFGDLNITLGDPEKALDYFREARALDSFFEPSWLWPITGVAHFMARQYEEAIAALERSNEPPYWAHLYMAASHAMLGNAERARHHAAETLRLKPDFTIDRAMTRQPLRRDSDRAHLLEALRKAGLPE